MAGPALILSIWIFVDRPFGTKDSMGAAVNTVGPVTKMGTSSTVVGALSRRRRIFENEMSGLIPVLPVRVSLSP